MTPKRFPLGVAPCSDGEHAISADRGSKPCLELVSWFCLSCPCVRTSIPLAGCKDGLQLRDTVILVLTVACRRADRRVRDPTV